MPNSSIIQALRGLAAAAVALCHQSYQLDPAGRAHALFSTFYVGVDIFFVISGYVIAISTSDAAKTTPMSFLTRRLFRIVPLAWTVIALMLLIIHADRGLVFRGLLFMPENPMHGQFPLVTPAWTLSYELFFYVVFTAALAISHRFRCELCLLAIGTLAVADFVIPHSGTALRSFFAADFFLEFAAGVLIAKILTHAPSSSSRFWPFLAGLFTFAIGVALCAIRPIDSGFFNFGCGAAVALAGLLIIERHVRVAIPHWLHGLGEISYSFYITQTFAFLFVEAEVFWTPIRHSWLYAHTAGPTRVVLVLVVALAIATLLHVVIEKPGIEAGRRVAAWLRRRPIPPPELANV